VDVVPPQEEGEVEEEEDAAEGEGAVEETSSQPAKKILTKT